MDKLEEAFSNYNFECVPVLEIETHFSFLCVVIFTFACY
ncbi:hypothetical protein Pedsa_2374 [Pseudopedobacter saltans DSM 12145]|uniref:Uncharacterized protein n=1 Tax=Pseudopedobacter saltans (strain ATCC 51119 / DSM 12145 / JCM 21818 / CCUG 39354 / LMG 10337 / NBRC 100064 / NCIMB 13643) TaxID=762903 RepID=F0SDZ6_PSESL|nr:hypothetical protein Pedsa_2374 [Pseudopedobacter saltans DSM 12145]